ncbi:uncharacterized protein SCHCODRAFT_01349133 [Schizophyllum commune H4-8]|uniref:C2H2-type domain-containing protein n=1 Tax=Schizophyllum commune (strain H4-8 / FGSC 9210) TaxID=578458 RepID=D8Q1D4_SCHCM|nr:uncharacterized protein SCHCODRAFT_01349133 [Schizophyllum commune H4-8]KAI5895373.1 hypothetical protein SCHCODRAFT_01349133 [Schizophyllum commune H4-8]
MQNTSNDQATSGETEPLQLSEEEFALLLRILGHDMVARLLEVPLSPRNSETVPNAIPKVPSAGHALSPEEWDACYSAIIRMTASEEIKSPPPANFKSSSSEAETWLFEAPTADQSCSQPLPRTEVSTALRIKATTARRKDPVAPVIPCTWLGCESTFTTRQGNLNDHLMLHENKQEFKCPVASCIKRFPTAGFLRNHLRDAHKEKASGFKSRPFIQRMRRFL